MDAMRAAGCRGMCCAVSSPVLLPCDEIETLPVSVSQSALGAWHCSGFGHPPLITRRIGS